MENTNNLSENRLADAWAELGNYAGKAHLLEADADRLAFADPEFLMRRETRGIRFQLEMLKPELSQAQQGIEHTVVVFGSARFCAPDVAQAALLQAQQNDNPTALAQAQQQVRNAARYEQARLFAQLVAKDNSNTPLDKRFFICTGGGPGIMEAANRGAHEVGAMTIGLNITLPHEQQPNPYITPSLNFKFHYFAARKMHFVMRAKALVAFPGGFGTLDELFEIITLVQTQKAKPVPIILFGSDYWKRLMDFDVLVEEGTIHRSDLDLIHYSDDPQEAWDYIKNFYPL
jgi:uncharacterized protein (TIGR00730 family)